MSVTGHGELPPIPNCKSFLTFLFIFFFWFILFHQWHPHRSRPVCMLFYSFIYLLITIARGRQRGHRRQPYGGKKISLNYKLIYSNSYYNYILVYFILLFIPMYNTHVAIILFIKSYNQMVNFKKIFNQDLIQEC